MIAHQWEQSVDRAEDCGPRSRNLLGQLSGGPGADPVTRLQRPLRSGLEGSSISHIVCVLSRSVGSHSLRPCGLPPPGSSIRGFSRQILKRVARPSSGGLPDPGPPSLGWRVFPTWVHPSRVEGLPDPDPPVSRVEGLPDPGPPTSGGGSSRPGSTLSGLLRSRAGSPPPVPPGKPFPGHRNHQCPVSLPSRILHSLHPHSDFQTEIHRNKAKRKGKENGKHACSPQGLKTTGATAARWKHS